MEFNFNPRVPFDPANPVAQEGKNVILFFRLLKNATAEGARKLAFQTEHSETIGNDAEATQTKDGAINSSAGATFEYGISSILAKNDPLARELKSAVIAGDIVECWEVVVDDDVMNDAGQFYATYMQGKLNGWEATKNSEESVSISTTLVVNQIPQEGYLDLTADERRRVQYAFRTLAPYTEDGSAPVAPTVTPLTAGATEIAGTAEAGAVVTAFLVETGEHLGSTKASETGGEFTIDTFELESGDSVRVIAKDSAGNISPETVVTVA